jgi:hypothetical protein
MTRPTHETPRFCLSCRYPLAGLAHHTCPECGRTFNPLDPRTTASHPLHDGRLALARTAQALTVVLAIASAIAIVVCAAGADVMLRWCAGFLLAPFILLLLIAAVSPGAPLATRWRLAGVASAALLASIIILDWPFRLVFEFHRPALNRAVQRVHSGEQAIDSDGLRIGMFSFRTARLHREGNIGFQLTGGPGGGTFLVRRAPGSTWIWYNTNWEQNLGGGWYRVYED